MAARHLPWILVFAASGCAERGPPIRVLAVSSDREAIRVVDAFLKATEERRIDVAASFLCEQDLESQGRAREFLGGMQADGSPYRIMTHAILRAEPKWEGTAPYFFVEASVPRNSASGEIVHGYHVRSADGCIEGLLGPAAPPPAPPAAAEAPPSPPPDELEL